MQFVIIGHDGTDADALSRRMSAREAHVEHIDATREKMIMGVATLDDSGAMNGSVMVVDFPSREALDAWLKAEPYVAQGVWKDVTVVPCKVGPSFLK